MPRSAIDATRFTPTTPHASAKLPRPSPPPGASSSTTTTAAGAAPASSSLSRNRTAGPAGETPQQKVRRLREAAARARDANVSGFDKIVVRGRVWADRAHRFTALSLITITAIAGVVTVYALGDMMIHNRRKRREYYAAQKAHHDIAVFEAQTALRHGTASEEQAALVDEEEMTRRALEAREVERAAKAAKEGIFAKGRNWLFQGLKKEDARGAEGEAMGEGVAEAMVQRTEREERMRLTAAEIGTAPGDDRGGMGGMGRESAILRAVEERNSEIRRR